MSLHLHNSIKAKRHACHAIVGLLIYWAGFTPALHAQTDSLPSPEQKSFSPIFKKDNRLHFHAKLPLRKSLDFDFPKFIYAGPSEVPDPNVSWQRSMLVPGWGQHYNKQGWKVPFVYGGYVVVGYLYATSQKNYTDFQRAYRIKIQHTDSIATTAVDSFFVTGGDTRFRGDASGLLRARDAYRRQRDYNILFMIGWHLFQVIEAYVGGQLKTIEVTDDISLQVRPIYRPRQRLGLKTGIGLSFSF